MEETHERFGLLRTEYSQQIMRRSEIEHEMRDNLLSRNGNSPFHTTYPLGNQYDIRECNLNGLYEIDYSLHQYGK